MGSRQDTTTVLGQPSDMRHSRQDWSILVDGTVDYDRECVKGTVELFFALKNPCTLTGGQNIHHFVLKTEGEREPNEKLHFNYTCTFFALIAGIVTGLQLSSQKGYVSGKIATQALLLSSGPRS